MAVKLKVNSEACVGCGLCVGAFPEAFAFDAENKAEVIGELDDAQAQEAIASCPAGAISE